MRYASDVLAKARQALRPPPRLQLSEWADAHYYLSADAGAADPGRWTCLPYQREILDALSDPRISQVTWMKSARVGATECMKALIAYHVDHDPCPILLIQPTESDATDFAKEGIEPMLRDCPSVGEKFISAKNRQDKATLRRFRGGVLQLASARTPGDFRRVSRRLIIGDEIDGYPESSGKEGSPMKLALRRGEYFWNRKAFWASTPLLAGASNIEREFIAGDQRRYYVPCPDCGAMQVLQFKNLKWTDRPPEDAVFICIECDAEIDHAHKRSMVERGEWRPGPHAQFPDVPPPPPFTGHASFHIWAAYGYSPNASWGHIAAEFVAASKAGAEELKTVINTVLGETWHDKGEAPDWQALYDRREPYEIGTCPTGVLFLTAAVDVQPNRLIYEVVGWGRNKESWSIDAGVIPGDTSDRTKGPWKEIDALLDRGFPHEAGAELRIRMLAVDTGDRTQICYEYVRTKGQGRVIAVKGVDSASVLVSSPSKVDVAPSGKRIGTIMLWKVGAAIGKSELYGWLRLRLPTDEARAEGALTPPGYCHFPEYGEDYFKQLTGEQLVAKKNARGFTTYVWEMVPGRENHHMDARRYARAAAAICGLDRLKESDYASIEQSLGVKTEPPPEEPPTTPTPAAPRPPKRQAPWVNRRPGGWLKGR